MSSPVSAAAVTAAAAAPASSHGPVSISPSTSYQDLAAAGAGTLAGVDGCSSGGVPETSAAPAGVPDMLSTQQLSEALSSSSPLQDAMGRVWLTQQDVMSLATYHSQVTILFADIKGFTALSQQLHPSQVMLFLNTLYSVWDSMLDEYGVYKVETIGDSYMVAGGLFSYDPETKTKKLGGVDPMHAQKVVNFGRAMLESAQAITTPLGDPVEIRVGVHSGACTSGVVGQRMPRFCCFGDSINTASRMETTCPVPGIIHASKAVAQLLPHEPWVPTGGVFCKGKGLMPTFVIPVAPTKTLQLPLAQPTPLQHQASADLAVALLPGSSSACSGDAARIVATANGASRSGGGSSAAVSAPVTPAACGAAASCSFAAAGATIACAAATAMAGTSPQSQAASTQPTKPTPLPFCPLSSSLYHPTTPKSSAATSIASTNPPSVMNTLDEEALISAAAAVARAVCPVHVLSLPGCKPLTPAEKCSGGTTPPSTPTRPSLSSFSASRPPSLDSQRSQTLSTSTSSKLQKLASGGMGSVSDAYMSDVSQGGGPAIPAAPLSANSSLHAASTGTYAYMSPSGVARRGSLQLPSSYWVSSSQASGMDANGCSSPTTPDADLPPWPLSQGSMFGSPAVVRSSSSFSKKVVENASRVLLQLNQSRPECRRPTVAKRASIDCALVMGYAGREGRQVSGGKEGALSWACASAGPPGVRMQQSNLSGRSSLESSVSRTSLELRATFGML